MEYIVLDTCVVMHILRGDDKGHKADTYLGEQGDQSHSMKLSTYFMIFIIFLLVQSENI